MDAFTGFQDGAQQSLLFRGKNRLKHDRSKPLQSIPQAERKEVMLDRIVDFLNHEGSIESEWTLSQLARAANTSRVTLYEYFGNLNGVREAVRLKLVGRVKPITAKLDDIPPEDRPITAVAAWMTWVDENRTVAIRALWIDESKPAFAGFVAETADALMRQIAEVYLGVTDPSKQLLRQIEVYLRGAEFCLRMWLLEGRMERDEVQTTIERLCQDVARMGEDRSDVPKPIPGRG